MNIEQFLGKRQCIKYSIVKELLTLQEHQISKNQLLSCLSISTTMLNQIVQEINSDISFLNLENEIKLVEYRKYGQKFYELKLTKSVSLDHFLLHYLTTSPSFFILVDIFFEKISSISEGASRYYFSESTFRRELNLLNKILKPYGLSINIQNKIYLMGSEWDLRLFSTSFLSKSFGTKRWPFKFISLSDSQKYIDLIPDNFFDTNPLKNNLSVSYLIAISIYRMRKEKNTNFIMESDYLYSEESACFKEFLIKGSQFFENYSPKTARDRFEIENRIIFTSLLLNGNFTNVKKLPYFFYRDPAFQKEELFQLGFTFLTQLESCLSSPLTMEEYTLLTYQFSLIAYRHFFLNQIDSTQMIPIKKIDSCTVDKVEVMTKYLLEREDNNFSEKKQQMLEKEYSTILLNTINWLRYKPILKLYLISGQDVEQLKKTILALHLEVTFNLIIVDKVDKEVDLIVSDAAYIENYLSEYPNVPVFYWESLSSSNNIRLYEKLSILNEKNWDKLKITL